MSKLVLYRKYRPKTFAEVVGQTPVIQTLTNAISQGMISHAYLFSGPRGSGKTTVARLLAKAVNCQDRKAEEYEPCNKCTSCLEINQGKAIDLLEIDAASNRGIDEIRDLRDNIRFSPTKSNYKVFIVDEAHQLTKEAANALLKTLEEPPPHAIFVLATTEIHKMIPTIISRCQRFDFQKLTLKEILKKLKFISQKEKIKIETRALELIALNSGGSIRDAESLLDQAITFGSAVQKPTLHTQPKIELSDIKDLLGIVDVAAVSQLVDFILEKKASQALNFLNEILEQGHDPHEFAKTLINYLRQALLLKINPNLPKPEFSGFTEKELEKLRSQVVSFTEQDLHSALKSFLEAQNQMRYSAIPQLPLELAIVELLKLEEK